MKEIDKIFEDWNEEEIEQKTMESKELLREQENLYWNSELKNKKWYRKLFGGEWRYLKLGKDTPYIGMFTVWTKMGDECWDGYFEVLETEKYPPTNINTKFKLYKEFIKQKIKKYGKTND